ncbi:glycosyltransferase family 4 protein [Cohnella hashimotonis]|uniref:Glycosyltransferase family 4 protein n=1 Tax=Cohnella hashimotonis TaxID=2826895 RepID=A0ABT6TCL8_9BACL|nr:glycosyltransferase family 4 protein [Cohnella hashimotonis]MDI4644565.1 glycosyltransferase family 4 protein [Cohnella hashimotonis]
MRLLFAYYLPSGGMETLNRLRAEHLRRHGVDCHLLYFWSGEGLGNNTTGIPTIITNDDSEIKHLIINGGYDAIFVSTDALTLARFRRLGFAKPLIYETQGLGSKEQARETLLGAAPFIRSFASAVLYPRTSHLHELFQGMFSDIAQFSFDNLLDTERFGYHPVPIHPHPIIGWIGRIEPNKNWRAYLQIGAELLRRGHDVHLWMFEDPTLNQPDDEAAFKGQLAALGLSDRVVRHYNVPNLVMSDYLSIIGDSGGFLASTSIAEGFGYAVGEALLCRCPVVAADSDGVRAFIEHSLTGLLYPQHGIGIAADLGEALLLDGAFREQMRTIGRHYVTQRFAPSLYVNNLLLMLRALGIG